MHVSSCLLPGEEEQPELTFAQNRRCHAITLPDAALRLVKSTANLYTSRLRRPELITITIAVGHGLR